MKRIFLVLVMLVFSLSLVPAFASDDCPAQYITGPVMKIDLLINRLWVQDEYTKETQDFFVHDNFLKDLRVGDRVRVNFRCRDLPPDSVLKMTPVENTGWQNK